MACAKRSSASASIASLKDVLHYCEDPATWICQVCGSTDSLLVNLSTPGVFCSGSDGHAGHAAAIRAKLWLALDHPFPLLDEELKSTHIGTNATLARTVARARDAVRGLKSLGGAAWERAHKWARVRCAVKLFGTTFLSRPSQLKRLGADLKATAIQRWLHADLGRAFRTWRSIARTPASEAEAAHRETEPAAPKRKRGAESNPTPRVSSGRAQDALRGRTGLRNLGNTCYMNSTLQLLAHLGPVRTALLALRNSASAPLVPVAEIHRQLSQHGGALPVATAPTSADSVPPPPPRLKRQDSGIADLFEKQSLSADAGPVVSAVHELFERLWGNEALAVYSPDAFIKRVWVVLPRFSGFRQQDAEEWLRALLCSMDAELSPPPAPVATVSPPAKRSRPPPHAPPTNSSPSAPAGGQASRPTLLGSILGGEIVSTVTCAKCSRRSSTREPFFGAVSLELPAGARGRCSLEDCFAAAFSDERLEGSSAYACEQCKTLVPATKSRRLACLPPVLIVHIVRTNWAGGGKKISTVVTPPLPGASGATFLDLAPWVAAPALERENSVRSSSSTRSAVGSGSAAPHYELRSLVEHLGSSMAQGHYMDYSIDDEGSWWQFNDARVSRVTAAQVGATQAYLMAFERCR
jgi:ubiquitin C-terminal hydrolase